MRAEDWARKRTDEMLATRRSLLQTIVIVVALAKSSPGRAQPVVATAYGEAITTLDIEQRTKFIEMATTKILSRQQVIDELTKEKLKVREAKKHGLNLSNDEVDLAYESMARRMRMTPEYLTQSLARAGSSADTVKHRIRADLADKYTRSRYPRGDFWMSDERLPGR
jgi:peptidyl-prolyl cis-trans isomerase SurA